jgi:hypothetical protein
VNPRLAPIEFEFFPAFRNRTACAHLWFVCARLRLRSNDNPCSALGACDARAHNAMGHMEIIWAAGSAFAVCNPRRSAASRIRDGCRRGTSVSFFPHSCGRPGTQDGLECFPGVATTMTDRAFAIKYEVQQLVDVQIDTLRKPALL